MLLLAAAACATALTSQPIAIYTSHLCVAHDQACAAAALTASEALPLSRPCAVRGGEFGEMMVCVSQTST